MRLIVNYTKNTEDVPQDNQRLLNTYIHKCLGNNNKYHDTFSDYAISSLQGGHTNEKVVNFNDGGYFIISSNNIQFIEDIISGIQKNVDLFCGMKLSGVVISDFNAHKDYDIVLTISPILLKRSDSSICIFSDDDFIDVLETNCKNKLDKLNINLDLSDFKIELYKPEQSKVSVVKVKKHFNKASKIKMIVRGNLDARKSLYNLGFGKSTGSGFGSIKILD